jgi:caa(3)-type oxidase subunit IV
MYRFNSEAVNVLLALFVASIKASLVALFFMHLKFEGKLIYLIFLVPLALCILLIVALMPDLLPMGGGSLEMFNTPEMMKNAQHAH